MAGTKTKVALTAKKPQAQAKRRKGRNNATSNSSATNGRGLSDMDVGLDPDPNAADDAPTMEDLRREFDLVKAALETERKQNAELRQRVEDMPSATTDSTGKKQVPRPRGTAGSNFSIQEAMGLAGSSKKYETYKGLQRSLRDLTMNARINWEVPWVQVPARDKAKLFEVARTQHPFLAQFERDWATEEIVKQFTKNKRKNHYANGWLEVPEQYVYLKENSRKRNPSASRRKRAKLGHPMENDAAQPEGAGA